MLSDFEPIADGTVTFGMLSENLSGKLKTVFNYLESKRINRKEAKAATDTEYAFLMDDKKVNGGGEIDYSLFQNDQLTLRIQLTADTGISAGTHIEWTITNSNIIEVQSQNDTDASVTLKILSPGYSGLSVSLVVDGVLFPAVAYCSVHVPLDWADSSIGNPNISTTSTNPYGLMTAQNGETDANKSLQLFTSNSSDYPNSWHYLRKLKYVNYEFTDTTAAARYTTPYVPSDINPDDYKTPSTALLWESSDTSVVEVDPASGMIRAVSAGFARITVTTNTTNKGHPDGDSLTFNVIVVPEAIAVGYTTDYKEKFSIVADPNQDEIVIQSNARFANVLDWELFSGDSMDKQKNVTAQYKKNIDISDSSGRVVLTGLPAGVYYLAAIDVKDKTASMTIPTYEIINAYIEKLGILIIVPFSFGVDELVLNYYNASVYDSYDLLDNSNLPANKFVFATTDVTVAKVGTNNGVIEAAGLGHCLVTVTPKDHAISDLFGSYAVSGGAIGGDFTRTVDVTVVNGVSINSTSATLPLGSTYQLMLTAPSPYTGQVTWKSSDDKIVKVDENGLVTAVGKGDASVTVKIKVNGVTKQARCKFKVVDSVNEIELSAKQDWVLVGDNLTVSAKVSPALANAELTWAISDTSLAKIADTSALSMTLTGVAEGTIVVSAVNKENAIVATKIIKVVQEINKLTLSDTDVTLSQKTGFYQLYAYCEPALPDSQKLTWSSSDKKVVTVDSNGKVTLVKPGKAVITVNTENGLIAQCNFTVTQGVTGINLDAKDITIYTGEKYRISYTIAPANATEMKLNWISIDTKVATVDSSGYVTAKNVGTTVVMVKATDGSGVEAMCKVTVLQKATSIKADVTDLSMEVGDIYQLEVSITPATSSDTLNYESSNSKVATVNKKGKITAKAKGNCVILIRTSSGVADPQYVNVEVSQPITDLELDLNEATIYVDEELELELTINPKNASDPEVEWKSANPDIATVNERGIIKGISGGTTMVTVVAAENDKVTNYCIVTVIERVTEITIQEEAEVGVGKKLKLEATVSGEQATNKNVTWKSSNKKIAKVDEKGVVRGVKVGTCRIIVTAADESGVYAECELTVINATESIEIDPSMTYVEIVVGESKTIKFEETPVEATYKPVWTSSDEKIAIVNQKGTITGIKAGSTTVVATAKDNPDVSGTVVVKVLDPINATNITFDASELVMTPGEEKNIVASFQPGNITESYTWSSDNPLVCSVDNNGHIYAKQVGTANITLMTKNSGKKATVVVYVVGLSETNVTLYQYEKLLLNLEIDGQSAGKLTIRWGTENQNIAVMNRGQVTAKATGTTYVYAMVNGRKLSCKVKVISNLK